MECLPRFFASCGCASILQPAESYFTCFSLSFLCILTLCLSRFFPLSERPTPFIDSFRGSFFSFGFVPCLKEAYIRFLFSLLRRTFRTLLALSLSLSVPTTMNHTIYVPQAARQSGQTRTYHFLRAQPAPKVHGVVDGTAIIDATYALSVDELPPFIPISRASPPSPTHGAQTGVTAKKERAKKRAALSPNEPVSMDEVDVMPGVPFDPANLTAEERRLLAVAELNQNSLNLHLPSLSRCLRRLGRMCGGGHRDVAARLTEMEPASPDVVHHGGYILFTSAVSTAHSVADSTPANSVTPVMGEVERSTTRHARTLREEVEEEADVELPMPTEENPLTPRPPESTVSSDTMTRSVSSHTVMTCLQKAEENDWPLFRRQKTSVVYGRGTYTS